MPTDCAHHDVHREDAHYRVRYAAQSRALLDFDQLNLVPIRILHERDHSAPAFDGTGFA
jgi:hypothetical protein